MQQWKECELQVRRGDVYCKTVDQKFCCSENFRPIDFKVGITGLRREVKKRGSISSVTVFWWAPDKVSLREERLQIRTEKISSYSEPAKHLMETIYKTIIRV